MKKQLLYFVVFTFSLFFYTETLSQVYHPFNALPSYLYGDNRYEPDINEIENIASSGTSTVNVTLPVLFNGLTEVDVTLKYHSIYADGFSVVSNLSNGTALDIDLNDYYAGTIDGNSESTVVIGIDKSRTCFVYINNGSEACLMKYDDNYGIYELYSEASSGPLFTSSDETINPDPAPAQDETIDIDSMPPTKCIGAYLEVAHDYYLYFNQDRQLVSNFIMGAFAVNTIIYAKESVPMKATQLYIWETPDPYNDTSIFAMVEHFIVAQPNFPGHIAQLIKKNQVTSGVAGVVRSGARASCIRKEHSVITTFDGVPNYPTYSHLVKAMTHEFGHTLGSPHTHSCSWQGGPIDNCYESEGICPDGPSGVPGSIMSYCPPFPFTNGFLRLPGNRIRETFLGFDPACLADGDNLPPLNECQVPANLTLSNLSFNSVTVSWNATSAGNYAVDYQKAGDTFPVTIYTTNTSVVLPLLTCGDYIIKVQSMCGYIGSHFAVAKCTPPTQASCKSEGQSTSAAWIESVQVNDVTITTGNNNGYHFEPCTYVNVSPGHLCYLVLKPGIPQFQPTPTLYWKVWIDVNTDNEIDPGDLTYDSGPTTGDVYVNAYIPVIPFVSSNYAPKIRIIMRENAPPDACGTYASGETEDYAANFVVPEYCFSRGLDDSQKWISRVQLNTLDHTTGASGGYYHANDGITTTLQEGETHTLQITSAHMGINRRMYYRAWIDYDVNEVFEANEMVLERYISQFLTTATQSFTIPFNADGNTRMRIAMKQYGYPDPCELFGIGEVEDYEIKVTNLNNRISNDEQEHSNTINSIYPSPTNENITVEIHSSLEQNAFLEVSDLSGKLVYKEGLQLQEGKQLHYISTAKYEEGLYFINIKFYDNSTSVKRIVVMH